MSTANKFEAVVVDRKYAATSFTGGSQDSIVLAFQVVAGDGVVCSSQWLMSFAIGA